MVSEILKIFQGTEFGGGGGGKGGGKGGEQPMYQPQPAPMPPPPTVDNSAEVKQARDKADLAKLKAQGLASTDETRGTLGDPTPKTIKPTLLGG